MIRISATLALLAFSLLPATAQDAAPAAPAGSEVVVDPAAAVPAQPQQADLLTGLYATKAVIEICAVTVDAAVTQAMESDEQRLETSLQLDAAGGDEAYAAVKADVVKTAPDCAEGSPDRAGVDAVTAIYQAASASTAPAAPAEAAAPAPAAQ
jgi:hypothetical protein